MECPHCRITFDAKYWETCPHCERGQEAIAPLELDGVLRTSTILISVGNARPRIYRSVEEVPEGLRRSLIESTHGRNSGTIYIADQRGRDHILEAARALPGSAPGPVLARLSRARAANAGQVLQWRPGPAAVWIGLMLLALTGLIVWVASGWA